MKKVVGKVTDEEKSAIMRLHNHSCSLEELLMILPENEELYKIALNDLNETKKKYQEWWDTNYSKYKWEKGNSDWSVVFETNEIIINE